MKNRKTRTAILSIGIALLAITIITDEVRTVTACRVGININLLTRLVMSMPDAAASKLYDVASTAYAFSLGGTVGVAVYLLRKLIGYVKANETGNGKD